jgi:hypothetical protein
MERQKEKVGMTEEQWEIHRLNVEKYKNAHGGQLPDSCDTCGHPSYWHSGRSDYCFAAYGDKPGLAGGERCTCKEYV